MEFFDAIILGIIEGLTEFLPISSTGHLILGGHLLNLPQTEFLKTFEISIQLGAILAVVALYWRRLLLNRITFLKVAVAFIPTGVIGFILYKIVKSILLESTQVVIWSLIIGGVVLILFELWYKTKNRGGVIKSNTNSEISYPKAFFIGAMQSLAMIPGVSRAGATIVAGLAAGIDRKTIVEFSFLLAVPTMFAATGYDLLKNAPSFSSGELPLLAVGFITAFVVALIVVKLFLRFVQKYSFISFGIYRIVAGLVMLWILS